MTEIAKFQRRIDVLTAGSGIRMRHGTRMIKGHHANDYKP